MTEFNSNRPTVKRATLAALWCCCLFASGCTQTVRFYDGPQRADDQVARIASFSVCALTVDGRDLSCDGIKSDRVAEVSPGTHTITTKSSFCFQYQWGAVGTKAVCLAPAGMTCFDKFSLKTAAGYTYRLEEYAEAIDGRNVIIEGGSNTFATGMRIKKLPHGVIDATKAEVVAANAQTVTLSSSV